MYSLSVYPSGDTSVSSLSVTSLASLNVASSAPLSIAFSVLLGVTFSTVTSFAAPSGAIISSLTPDEKHNYLFDINGLLEVQTEDFDNNWWQLVSNIWTQ
ncbi:hypothetical protein C2G38_2190469 [Gigaspora rosea]|uniref:Uncharacterized protein n=1 Tax=Gigaspora rosea TaxID=44941 RepID=A0A397V1A3_9GLOM|nr:hypothetical protein C2G38_2190469 [Gigaspora rosea]